MALRAFPEDATLRSGAALLGVSHMCCASFITHWPCSAEMKTEFFLSKGCASRGLFAFPALHVPASLLLIIPGRPDPSGWKYKVAKKAVEMPFFALYRHLQCPSSGCRWTAGGWARMWVPAWGWMEWVLSPPAPCCMWLILWCCLRGYRVADLTGWSYQLARGEAGQLISPLVAVMFLGNRFPPSGAAGIAGGGDGVLFLIAVGPRMIVAIRDGQDLGRVSVLSRPQHGGLLTGFVHCQLHRGGQLCRQDVADVADSGGTIWAT